MILFLCSSGSGVAGGVGGVGGVGCVLDVSFCVDGCCAMGASADGLVGGLIAMVNTRPIPMIPIGNAMSKMSNAC